MNMTIDEIALAEWAEFHAITLEQARSIFDSVEGDDEAEAKVLRLKDDARQLAEFFGFHKD